MHQDVPGHWGHRGSSQFFPDAVTTTQLMLIFTSSSNTFDTQFSTILLSFDTHYLPANWTDDSRYPHHPIIIHTLSKCDWGLTTLTVMWFKPGGMLVDVLRGLGRLLSHYFHWYEHLYGLGTAFVTCHMTNESWFRAKSKPEPRAHLFEEDSFGHDQSENLSN